jgi:hypothetical protein
MVEGLGFSVRFYALWLRVKGLGFRIQDLGCRV